MMKTAPTFISLNIFLFIIDNIIDIVIDNLISIMRFLVKIFNILFCSSCNKFNLLVKVSPHIAWDSIINNTVEDVIT